MAYDTAVNPSPARAALAGLAVLAVAMGIGRFAFTPLLPQMQQEVGLDVAAGGWLAAANYLGYLVGALTAAGREVRPAVAIRTALVVVGVSTAAMGAAGDFGAWLALRFAAGVASAWALVFTSAWCLERIQAEAAPARKAHLAATLFAGVGTGIAVAGVTCLALFCAGVGAAAAWYVLGALALASAAALWNAFGSRPVLQSEAAVAGRPAGTLRMTLCYGAFGLGYIVPATFIAAMARAAQGTAAGGLYEWTWPLFGATAAASTFIAGAARTRWSDRRIWIVGALLMALGVVAPLAIAGFAGFALSALLVGGTFMVVTMTGIQEARRVAGPRARALIAAMTAAFAVGQIVGPLLVTLLPAPADSPYASALWVAAAVLVLSAAALLPPRPKESP